jgi:hypothetical protein
MAMVFHCGGAVPACAAARDVAVAIAFAAADVQEQALGVDIAHLQAQAFAQTESAGIDRGQADAVIEGLDLGEDGADLGADRTMGSLNSH